MAKQYITWKDVALNQVPNDFDIELVTDELTEKRRFTGRYAKCPVCTRWFKMKNIKQECCSRECSMSLKASRGHLGRKGLNELILPVYVFKRCPNCKRLYKVSRDLLEEGHGLFCSVRCARHALSFHPDIKYYICNSCGRHFPMIVNSSMMLFCSLNCLGMFMLAHHGTKSFTRINHLVPKPYQEKKYASYFGVKHVNHIELVDKALIEAARKQKTIRKFNPDELIELYGKKIKKTPKEKLDIILRLTYDEKTGLYDVLEYIYTAPPNPNSVV